jgi:GTP cyclohydrolase III
VQKRSALADLEHAFGSRGTYRFFQRFRISIRWGANIVPLLEHDIAQERHT